MQSVNLVSLAKKASFRILRILKGKKGIYGEYGKNNHFAEGVLVYENARIGNSNYFAPYSLINNAVIGNYCSIGPGCRIGLGEHDLQAISTYPRVANGKGGMQLLNPETPSVIGHDVWLGTNAVIRQGVKVGTGAVIGANAVVTRDIPEYAVAIGVPAKVIKFRFDEAERKRILESEWFLCEPEQAKKIVSALHNEK